MIIIIIVLIMISIIQWNMCANKFQTPAPPPRASSFPTRRARYYTRRSGWLAGCLAGRLAPLNPGSAPLNPAGGKKTGG